MTESGKAVAGVGDVTATPGTKMFTGADTGTWSAVGDVTVVPYPKLRAGGDEVIYQASCAFKFEGKAGNTPVFGAETVTLTASGEAKLQKGGSGVLRDGDGVEGDFGNRLDVASSRTLRSS